MIRRDWWGAARIFVNTVRGIYARPLISICGGIVLLCAVAGCVRNNATVRPSAATGGAGAPNDFEAKRIAMFNRPCTVIWNTDGNDMVLYPRALPLTAEAFESVRLKYTEGTKIGFRDKMATMNLGFGDENWQNKIGRLRYVLAWAVSPAAPVAQRYVLREN